ncbi:MAG: hypothetical protein BWZ10_02878 [candidate division BRC1 bacterium ADurb.BinA364]|nr:MAG: hypothetical protein BWZ10_02878 [candidate division BRC1 bacterium ADurb.BinA364]
MAAHRRSLRIVQGRHGSHWTDRAADVRNLQRATAIQPCPRQSRTAPPRLVRRSGVRSNFARGNRLYCQGKRDICHDVSRIGLGGANTRNCRACAEGRRAGMDAPESARIPRRSFGAGTARLLALARMDFSPCRGENGPAGRYNKGRLAASLVRLPRSRRRMVCQTYPARSPAGGKAGCSFRTGGAILRALCQRERGRTSPRRLYPL